MIYRRCSGCRKLSPKKLAEYNQALIQAYQAAKEMGNSSKEAKELGEKAKAILEKDTNDRN